MGKKFYFRKKCIHKQILYFKLTLNIVNILFQETIFLDIISQVLIAIFQLQCFFINFHRKFAFVFIVICFIEFEVFIDEKIRFFFPTTEYTKFIIRSVYQRNTQRIHVIRLDILVFSLIIIFSHNILNIVTKPRKENN